MALEHSAKGRCGFTASFTNAGTPTGAVLGTFVLGLFAAMPEEQFLSWGWRVPFLLSALLLAVGVLVHSQVSESPIFQAALAEEAAEGPAVKRKAPIVEVLSRPPRPDPHDAGRSLRVRPPGLPGHFRGRLRGRERRRPAVVSAVFILLTRESKDFDLETHEHWSGLGPPHSYRSTGRAQAP